MKRYIFFAAALLALGALLSAQETTMVSTRVFSDVPDAPFSVDGQIFYGSATFIWPEGSKHILSSVTNGERYEDSCRRVISSSTGGTWTDNLDEKLDGSTIAVTAHPEITWYHIGGGGYTEEYKVRLEFSNDNANGLFACTQGPEYGKVYMDGKCYDRTTDVWMSPRIVPFQAYPPPGFVFVDWAGHEIQGHAYEQVTLVKSCNLIYARFEPAASVTVESNPAGMQVLVDTVPVPTPRRFDWAANSTHRLGPVNPQGDETGGYWVFDSWAHGGADNQFVQAGNANVAMKFVANYVRGAKVSFNTNPVGLKLIVDGKDWLPQYNLVWGVGSKHAISAPPEQYDAQGRKYVFNSWSTEGGPEQVYTVTSAEPWGALATYDVLGRLRVESMPGDIDIMIDGQACHTPCQIDRKAGTEVKVGVPANVPLSDNMRLDFGAWSDGGARERIWKAGTDAEKLVVTYKSSSRIVATSDPAGGVNFRFDPPTTDGFFPVDTDVKVTAETKPGYKFKWWEGDAGGIYKTVSVKTTLPVILKAVLERVPFVAETGVRNAAGDTPEQGVAPGSVISIYGGGLSADYVKGPDSPLAQSLANITVQVADRVLPLMFVSPDQINAQLLSDLPEGEYKVLVRGDSQPDATAKFTVQRNAPGLFAQVIDSKQFAVALHADGKAVTRENPAVRGETVTLLGTGFGPYKEGAIDGFAIPQGMQMRLVDPVEIQAGDKTITPVSATAAQGYAGITAIRIKIGEELPAATNVELTARANGHESNKVLLPVK